MKKAKEEKSFNRGRRYSNKDKFLVFLPYVVNLILFTVIAFFFSKYMDNKIFANCYGRNSEQTVTLFIFFAAVFACCFTWLFQKPLYKIILKGRNYDEFQLIVGAVLLSRTRQKGYYKELRTVFSVISIFFLIATIVFVILGCFNGIAFNDEGDIVYKRTAFSQKQVIDFESVEIGKLTDDDSWNYAFKLNDKWYGFSTNADSQTEKIITDNIIKYDLNVEIYESIEDIEK